VRHVAAFSGGKDSTALLLWLREQGLDYTAVFCDTGWEHPLTYAYIDEINHSLLGGRLVTLHPDIWTPRGISEKYRDMRDLVARKGRVPSVMARFCTQYLKTNPMRAWIEAQDDEIVLYQGIRAEESPSRAQMEPACWSDYYDCRVERPLFRWRAQQVFELITGHGIEANPLYRLGAGRVGCFPCVLTRHAELRRMSKMLPEVWDRIAELEALSGRSYFPPEFIPAQFCSNVAEIEVEVEPGEAPTLFDMPAAARLVRKVVAWPSIPDVRTYLETHEADLERYGETPTCMSVYNLCER
jgi:3'-phosphoadenosine 5'-phosphosulfate sulfotransferase (PAPS reductase)/FAD synthetase